MAACAKQVLSLRAIAKQSGTSRSFGSALRTSLRMTKNACHSEEGTDEESASGEMLRLQNPVASRFSISNFAISRWWEAVVGILA